jgi:hypothetical protein
MECPDGLGEAPGGDRPVPLGAESPGLDRLLVLPLRLPKLSPDPAPEIIGKGRRFRQQLAREQAPVAVGPKASRQDRLKQRGRNVGARIDPFAGRTVSPVARPAKGWARSPRALSGAPAGERKHRFARLAATVSS